MHTQVKSHIGELNIKLNYIVELPISELDNDKNFSIIELWNNKIVNNISECIRNKNCFLEVQEILLLFFYYF